MTGASLKIDAKLNDHQLHVAMERLLYIGANMKLVYQDIGEYLHQSHNERFDAEVGPDGKPWEPLAPATLKRKRTNKILQERGYLKGLLRYQATNEFLAFGSDRVYAHIQHEGGTIDIAARSQQLHFKISKDGTVGNRFVKKKNSNFAQWASMAAYTIDIPARPFIGLSAADRTEILRIIGKHADRALSGLVGSYGG